MYTYIITTVLVVLNSTIALVGGTIRAKMTYKLPPVADTAKPSIARQHPRTSFSVHVLRSIFPILSSAPALFFMWSRPSTVFVHGVLAGYTACSIVGEVCLASLQAV